MRKIPSLIALLGMIGMIGCITPTQGWGQNPWDYQRTIRVTDSLVEVFKGDGMDTLLNIYCGPVKGSDLYANPRSPGWDILRNRFTAKNGQTFWIDMNTIQGLTEIWGLGGSDPATLHPNNMIEVWGAGIVAFYYSLNNGSEYYISSHVNYFGVTQWAGADLPSETILVVEDGSELNGTFSTEGYLYLAENEVIGVEEWQNNNVWWCNVLPNGTYIFLFSKIKEVTVGSLIDEAFSVPKYGNSFTLEVAYDDGTSNGPQYCNSMQYFTLKDHRSVHVTGIQLNKTELILVRLRSEQLIATVLPSNATNKKVIWHSSDTEIASVDQNGLVTAHEAGEATITATTEDGGYTATCLVTVTFNTSVEEVETTKIQIQGQQVTVFGNGEVKIYDLSGRVIRSGEVVGFESFFLNKGVYLLKMGERIQKIAVF